MQDIRQARRGEPPEVKNAKGDFRFPQNARKGGSYGIDVSRHQGVIDWNAVSDSGVSFTDLKATGGVTCVDPHFRINLSGARDAGLPAGVYHFLSSGDPVDQQVEHFLQQYGDKALSHDLPPVLDLERDYIHKTAKHRRDTRSAAEIADMALAWLQAVGKRLKRKPFIYTNRHWWDQRIGQKE